MPASYIAKVTTILKAHANPQNAESMVKYMRNQFAYFGIKAPILHDLFKQFIKENGVPDSSNEAEVIRALWDLPEREYQYAAMTILAESRKRPPEDRIKLLEELIITKSWWDTIDSLAANDVGLYFVRYPDSMLSYTEKWMNSGNFWLQRTALLFQLKYKTKTDTDLLFKYIGQCANVKEFFIRKAIGWVLREYSKTDAAAVLNYVEHNTLSPLSSREALKWLSSQSKIEHTML